MPFSFPLTAIVSSVMLLSLPLQALERFQGENSHDTVYSERSSSGKPDGFTLYEMDLGSIYMGNYRSGRLNGYGLRLGLDEDVFLGTFAGGNYQSGVFVDVHTGRVQVGTWKNDTFSKSDKETGWKAAREAMIYLDKMLRTQRIPQQYSYLIDVTREKYHMLKLLDAHGSYSKIQEALSRPVRQRAPQRDDGQLASLQQQIADLQRENTTLKSQEPKVVQMETDSSAIERELTAWKEKYATLEGSKGGLSTVLWTLVAVLVSLLGLLYLLIKKPFLFRPKLKRVVDDAELYLQEMKETQKENAQLKKRNTQLEALDQKRMTAEANQATEEADRDRMAKELQKAEIEQAFQLKKFPFQQHLTAFLDTLENIKSEDVSGDAHSQFLSLHEGIKKVFAQTGQQDLNDLANVSKDVKRINQIETVIKHYGHKMTAVKQDENLDEELRETQVLYWQRLMDTEVAKLEEL